MVPDLGHFPVLEAVEVRRREGHRPPGRLDSTPCAEVRARRRSPFARPGQAPSSLAGSRDGRSRPRRPRMRSQCCRDPRPPRRTAARAPCSHRSTLSPPLSDPAPAQSLPRSCGPSRWRRRAEAALGHGPSARSRSRRFG
jgi:hypothetical protein